MRVTGPAAKGVWMALCATLALQTAVSRRLSVREMPLPVPELHKVPFELGRWTAFGEQTLDTAVTEYLKPDEYILRNYVDGTNGQPISVFVAYFKSLQNNFGPHSPRACLPGSGWLVRSSKIAPVPVPGQPEGIPVNEYVMEKGNDRILVLYWYQNDRDIWAEEFHAKLRMLPDLIRHRRSDVSLVRIITPISGADGASELGNCLAFTKLIFPQLAERLATAGG